MDDRYKYIPVSNYLEIGEDLEIPDPIKNDVEALGGLEKIGKMTGSIDELEEKGRIFKALSDPLRIKILQILHIQPLCVCCIKELFEISDSKLSYHLSLLKEAGLILGRQEKNWIIYRPTDLGKKMINIEIFD